MKHWIIRKVSLKLMIVLIVGVYFSPSLLESFVQTSLTLTFNSNHTNVNCTSFTDCRSFENGYCVKGKCIASNAYYHNAVDPAVKGKFI